jgi:hypothetical protein
MENNRINGHTKMIDLTQVTNPWVVDMDKIPCSKVRTKGPWNLLRSNVES